MPTFNGETYVLEALSSVNKQTYTNIEIVISDDNSKDATLTRVDEFKMNSKFPINIIHHSPNGIAENWNYCIKNAKGKYIKFLFQDDLLKLTCIEKMVKVLEADKSIGLVTCKRTIISEINNRFTQGWIANFRDLQVNLNLPDKSVVIKSGRAILRSSKFKLKPINIIGEPTCIMFPKAITAELGGFHSDMFQLVDYEFCLRIFKDFKIAFLQEQLAGFRLHDMQASFINHQKLTNDKEVFYKLLYKDYFWYLHLNFKWVLIRRFHWLFRFYRGVKKNIYKKELI